MLVSNAPHLGVVINVVLCFFLSSLMHPALDRKDMRQCDIQEDLMSEGKRHVIEGNERRQWCEWVTKDPRWVVVGFFSA